jgi:thioredoxin-dependent peroxiredoxin
MADGTKNYSRGIALCASLLAAGTLAGCLAAGAGRQTGPQAQKGLASSNEKETLVTERKNLVTMKGRPLTLLGSPLRVGEDAPDFVAVKNDLSEASLSQYRGKVVLLAAVPSLDTSVCSLETRRFNQEAAALGEDVAILVVSMDLPFAQKRWCGAEGVQRLATLSDHRDASFGLAYGVLVKELRLLARSVFVVGRDGKLVYEQIVPEMTNEPDYQAALEAVKKARQRGTGNRDRE